MRVDNGTSGPLTVRVETLIDAKTGKAFKRFTLTGDKLKATLLRDDKGKTVHVAGPGPYSGWAKGFTMPAKLTASPSEAPAAPTAPGQAPAPKAAPAPVPRTD